MPKREGYPRIPDPSKGLGEFYDEIILHCSFDGCVNKGKDVFVDVRLLDEHPMFYLHDNRIPICEHMWRQAKEDLDYEIEYLNEQAQLKWCSNCIKRIPKDATVCPECGASPV